MKKNLKKVISAVLALTLAMSSFVAMTTSAATFADVADTASYAEAVNALAALGAIAGTGDGTFKPDDNITRAEAATMIVAALNLSADAQNAGATSKFADVNAQAKWAVGYVNVGVAQNYISGTSATTFNPLDNVTYAQMLTMLTRILGYGDFAVSRGGYPDGYVTSASIAGIVKGVAAGTEEAITRAQAAQLIWNAVQAPMLDITTFTGSIADTELKKMDGSIDSGNKFKTVLSDKYSAYVLDVKVTGTPKSGGLEDGEVDLEKTTQNQWDPSNKFNYGVTLEDVAVGKTVAADYLFSSAKAIVEYDEYDDEWALIYFAPSGKVSKKTVDGTLVNLQAENPAGLVETTKTVYDENNTPSTVTDYFTLNIKKAEGVAAKNSNDYKLAADTELYVNGHKFFKLSSANLADARTLIAASTGDTVLVQDMDATGARQYDVIMIDVYALANVSQVKSDDDKTTVKITNVALPSVRVPGSSSDISAGSNIEVKADDVEDGEKVVTVAKDGAAATLSALAEDDVIAVKYDLTGEINDAKYIDILATAQTASGVYTSKDDDTGVYVVSGVEYKVSGNAPTGLGKTYTLYLDPFGKIFEVDELATSVNYAIVEGYNTADSTGADYDSIDVMTLDGQSKRLYVEDDKVATVKPKVVSGLHTEVNGKSKAWNGTTLKPIAGRLISYTVKTSTGRVNAVENLVSGTDYTVLATDSVYKSATNRLGSATLADTAAVLDATKYTTGADKGQTKAYKASSLSSIVEDTEYDAIVVHKNNDMSWGYVIVTKAGNVYATNSDFAVISAKNFTTASATRIDDEDVALLKVAGADEELKVSMDAVVYVNGVAKSRTVNATTVTDLAAGVSVLKEGNVIFYTVGGDGYVDRIDVLFDVKANIDTLDNQASATVNGLITLPAGTNVVSNDWQVGAAYDFDGPSDNLVLPKFSKVQFFYAPVVAANKSTVSFGDLVVVDANSKKINVNTTYDFAVAEDANIYSYDVSEKGLGATAFEAGASFYGINQAKVDANNDAWIYTAAATSKPEYDYRGEVCYALVMAVDDIITNALIFEDLDTQY